ncbi:hypothetical protein PA598K_00383 [Paenibacillus sp. 598K]|uniref:glycosyltransferase family 4 protein n=1 Tax=Paenibacillus sp. 598K TaxID=1117987 RepID=UPI000FFA740B|nr:glycosyltransferase family 4 protein [Paenibacillus sp. 598K]GBF72146.1 hypothetical protein PA598K_00383 [Paenibacillus sp. 598K]
MKILLLADNLIAGGLETHIITQINELLRRGYEIRLAAASITPELRAQIRATQGSFHFDLWDEKLDLDAVVRAFDPDMIHAHPFAAIIKGAELVSRIPKPYIVTVHGAYDFGLDRSPTGYTTSEQVRRIIAVDERVSKQLLRSAAHPEKVIVIPNGIDMAAFASASAEKNRAWRLRHSLAPYTFTLATVCRLADGKQQAVVQVIRCAGRLAQRLGGLNLIIVGSGDHADEVEEQVNEAMRVHLNDGLRILIAGHRQDVSSYMNGADLVMACGRAAMEAMACGTAVYGMRDGFAGPISEQTHDLILGAVSGFAQLQDEALIDQLEQLARDTAARDVLAAAGPQIIARAYDLRTCTDQLERIYRQYSGGGNP